MNTLPDVLAGLMLLAAAAPAAAQHGGHFHGGGGFHGGGFHGRGFHGGHFHGGRFHGAPFWGFGLGLGYGYPWYGYGYSSTYSSHYDYAGPFPPGSTRLDASCGTWIWHPETYSYGWLACGATSEVNVPMNAP
ncbi:MAG TPA: hypothetical protein VJS38_20450 [Phenylobacterium sp.]|uniref:hypothetical protein n=1 Tax=Phenylobacterium sp. TaxID=1871053 RepID=UPI002B48A470|nr:hypothetical protein [Phenylobacterium sp.]HKR90547.1 hypothetical protein [Phenylobacterium sp.]